jgi:hypothetical protein
MANVIESVRPNKQDQSKREKVRALEWESQKVAETAGGHPRGIIPGNRGMEDRSWFGFPLCQARKRRATGSCHQLLWAVSQPSGDANQELRGEARIETASEPSEAQRKFRPWRPRSYPEGNWLLLRTQHGKSAPGPGTHGIERPQTGRSGRATAENCRGAGGRGKARKTSSLGAAPQNGVTQLQTERQPER